MTIPRPPAGAGAAGRRLWRGVTGEFELSEAELALLAQAVHVADTCADLQRVIDSEGLLLDGRAHPALVELRQQRALLGRLLAALRIPDTDAAEDEAPPRTQRRAARGFYKVKGDG